MLYSDCNPYAVVELFPKDNTVIFNQLQPQDSHECCNMCKANFLQERHILASTNLPAVMNQ